MSIVVMLPQTVARAIIFRWVEAPFRRCEPRVFDGMSAHPTVLIAVDIDGGGERAARAASALFGADATYRFAHVAQPVPMAPPTAGAFPAAAGVAPVGTAPVVTEAMTDQDVEATIDSAQSVAARAARDAGLPAATAVGLIGDPADAVIEEALRCGAQAIVVTPHHHGWIDRLFHRSIADEIRKVSPVPVVVVPSPD
jgi:nucleotide-binding universal stress UspA family protein